MRANKMRDSKKIGTTPQAQRTNKPLRNDVPNRSYISDLGTENKEQGVRAILRLPSAGEIAADIRIS
jgi:hypothetical protein